MYQNILSFNCQHVGGKDTPLHLNLREMVIAGWAGRNQEAVEHHIAELAAIGVPRPSRIPLFYRVAVQMLTQWDTIHVLGEGTSGEVEPLLFSHAGSLYVSVTSDHTDRQLEAYGVAQSKQICPKPVARDVWLWDDVKAHWDEVILRSWHIDTQDQVTLYQEGTAASLRAPTDLLAQYLQEDGYQLPPDGLAMSCGTVATIGAIRPAHAFRIALHDPVLQRDISHTYSIDTLPVVA